jgi:hypothetical protein
MYNKYKPEYVRFVYEMCLLGATNEVITRALGIHEKTFYRWQQEFPDFGEAVKAGKEVADAKVALTLYQKANGYSHKRQKVFCDPRSGSHQVIEYTENYPPDTAVMIFWLKNRRPDMWRDVCQHEVGEPGDFSGLSDAELREKAIAAAESLGLADMADGLRQGQSVKQMPKRPTNDGTGTMN